MLSDKPILLNEMVISSGNENNTHFSVSYETDELNRTDLYQKIITLCFGQQINRIYPSACENIQEVIKKLSCCDRLV